MKKILSLSFLFFCLLATQAQELQWHTNVTEAIKISDKQKKPLLLFFTGSDWCGWCIRLQKEVLTTPEFAAWANKNVVLVELDYPKRKKLAPETAQQNAELQQVFGIQGFPTIYLAKATKNKQGKTNFSSLGSTGYVAGGPKNWIATADSFLIKK